MLIRECTLSRASFFTFCHWCTDNNHSLSHQWLLLNPHSWRYCCSWKGSVWVGQRKHQTYSKVPGFVFTFTCPENISSQLWQSIKSSQQHPFSILPLIWLMLSTSKRRLVSAQAGSGVWMRPGPSGPTWGRLAQLNVWYNEIASSGEWIPFYAVMVWSARIRFLLIER